MWRLASKHHPSGPHRWESHQFNLSGSSVNLSAPEQNDKRIEREYEPYYSLNIYGDNHFSPYDKNKSEPQMAVLLVREWSFHGFLGRLIGNIIFHVTVSKLPEFCSLFRPTTMECAIERYIYTSRKSPQMSGGSRLNWNAKQINNIVWANYYFNSEAGFHNAEECYGNTWHTAITDEHLLTVNFKEIIRTKNSKLRETYQRVIDKIMSSFTIELSADALAQKEAVQKNFPNETLSEELPPYVFEEYTLLDELSLVDKVAARYNFEKAYELMKEEIAAEDKKQKHAAQEVRQRVLNSHLRFKNMHN